MGLRTDGLKLGIVLAVVELEVKLEVRYVRGSGRSSGMGIGRQPLCLKSFKIGHVD